MAIEPEFWKTKPFEAMTLEEWEALCDGCAKCCLHKIEDIETGEVFFTDVACRLLDVNTCQCLHYEHRSDIVPDCVHLTPEKVQALTWLPKSCAYRRLAEGRDLAWWHPLVSGTQDTMISAGISVCGRVVSEMRIKMSRIMDHVVDWVD